MPLPPLPTYPTVKETQDLPASDWTDFEDASTKLCEAYLRLPDAEFDKQLKDSDSVPRFLTSYLTATSKFHQVERSTSRQLRHQSFLLTHRTWLSRNVPEQLASPSFVGDFCVIYGKVTAVKPMIENLWSRSGLDSKPMWLKDKNHLISIFETLGKGTKDNYDEALRRIVALLRCSNGFGRFLMVGTDFLDALTQSWRTVGSSLRPKITTIAFLSLISLIAGETKSVSLAVDHLYALRADVDNNAASESLLADLISKTPFLRRISSAFEASESGRAKSMNSYLKDLNVVHHRPKPRPSRADKGKGADRINTMDDAHVHKMSLITQIQDLFPYLGTGFIAKFLDEYNDNVETVTAHLLDGTLPVNLQGADQSEQMSVLPVAVDLVAVDNFSSDLGLPSEAAIADLAPSSATVAMPQRRNVFDNDDLDTLEVSAARLHIGRKEETSKLPAANKASILAALAAIDPDDDERDDTYDGDDVGGTIDTKVPGNDDPDEMNFDDRIEEALFSAWKAGLEAFRRDADTRRGQARAALRLKTGLTDEAIEGWAVMAQRSPKALQRLEAKYSTFSGEQQELGSTSWRAENQSDGQDNASTDRGGFRGRGGRRPRGSRGGGRGRGDVAGPPDQRSTQKARQQKDASKASRANHNRKDQRGKKLARGGFP